MDLFGSDSLMLRTLKEHVFRSGSQLDFPSNNGDMTVMIMHMDLCLSPDLLTVHTSTCRNRNIPTMFVQ